MKKLTRWLAPPSFPDEDKTRSGRILYAVLLVTFFSVIAFAITVPLISSNPVAPLLVVMVLFLLTTAIYLLLQSGRVWLAGFLFTVMLWFIITPVHFLFGGIHNVGITVQIVVVVIAGLILGKRATILFTALAIMVVTAVVLLEMIGFLPESLTTLSPLLLGLNFIVTLLAISSLLFVATSGLSEALDRARSNERKLVSRNEELAEIRRSLEENIAQLEKTQNQIKAYASELERSNRELQDFAYVVSHDLQAPLRKIRIFGDRLLSNYNDLLDERGQDYIDRMQNASDHMKTLIEDLLLFSRVQTQGQPFAIVNLNEVLQAVLGDLETRIEEVNGRIIDAELPSIEADKTQMRQLFQNLISNALKFRKRGVPPEVIITLESSNKDSEYITISVKDNGIGFEPQYVDRIFRVFERLHNREEYEGTGIGLAICKRIVDRHHGSITAVSQPGQGTQFDITLPIYQIRNDNPQYQN